MDQSQSIVQNNATLGLALNDEGKLTFTTPELSVKVDTFQDFLSELGVSVENTPILIPQGTDLETAKFALNEVLQFLNETLTPEQITENFGRIAALFEPESPSTRTYAFETLDLDGKGSEITMIAPGRQES